jgi:hypothetical protein
VADTPIHTTRLRRRPGGIRPMISHSSPNLQTIRTAAYAATLLLAATAPAHADMGVPMLAVVWPLSWLLLIPVIAIEAVVAYRLLGNDWRKSFKISAIANLVSTLVGIPLVWVIWLLFEYVASSMFPKAAIGVTHPSNPLLTAIAGAWIFLGYPITPQVGRRSC